MEEPEKHEEQCAAPGAAHADVCKPVFVSRRPIFDKQQDVWGYELLLRPATQLFNAEAISDEASARVIADGVAIALAGAAGSAGPGKGRQLLFQCAPPLLRMGLIYALPKEHCIPMIGVEKPDKELRHACEAAKAAGYTLGASLPIPKQIFPLAGIIKLDLRRFQLNDVQGAFHGLQEGGAQLMVGGINTKDELKELQKNGVTLFEGPLFSKAELVQSSTLRTAALTRIRAASEMLSGEFDTDKMAAVVSADPSLSYRLLRLINSPHYAFSTHIRSVKQAITLLGQAPFRYWLLAVSMAEASGTPAQGEAYLQAVQRGRFLQTLAERSPSLKHLRETLQLLGLFSKLDVLLGVDMPRIVDGMPLDKELKDVLCGAQNSMSAWLSLVEGVEDGEWNDVGDILHKHGMEVSDAAICYNMATLWAKELMGGAEESAP